MKVNLLLGTLSLCKREESRAEVSYQALICCGLADGQGTSEQKKTEPEQF